MYHRSVLHGTEYTCIVLSLPFGCWWAYELSETGGRMGKGVALKHNLLTTTCSQTWLAQADLFQIRSNNSFCNVWMLWPMHWVLLTNYLLKSEQTTTLKFLNVRMFTIRGWMNIQNPKTELWLKKSNFLNGALTILALPKYHIWTPLQSNMHCGAFWSRLGVFFIKRWNGNRKCPNRRSVC